MTLKDIVRIPNGITATDIKLYECDKCGITFSEANAHESIKDCDYCLNCAFVKGLCSEKAFLGLSGVSVANASVVIKHDVPIIVIDETSLRESGY